MKDYIFKESALNQCKVVFITFFKSSSEKLDFGEENINWRLTEIQVKNFNWSSRMLRII